MFDYTVSRDNSQKIFKIVCQKIAETYSSFEMQELLIDVDGSTIQVFKKSGDEIRVFDDYDVGAVYVTSDVNLDDLFLKK